MFEKLKAKWAEGGSSRVAIIAVATLILIVLASLANGS